MKEYKYFINDIPDIGTLVVGSLDGPQVLKILAQFLSENPEAGRRQAVGLLCTDLGEIMIYL